MLFSYTSLKILSYASDQSIPRLREILSACQIQVYPVGDIECVKVDDFAFLTEKAVTAAA